MSRLLGLALLIGGLGGCTSSTIVLGSTYPPDAGSTPTQVPTVEVLPSPVDFGGVAVDGGAAKQLFITLLNAGTTQPVVVTFGTLSPPFSPPPSSQTLFPLPVGPTQVPVTFQPLVAGPVQGFLSYQVCPDSASDGGCSPPRAIELKGKGL